jgi:hypothetical protein
MTPMRNTVSPAAASFASAALGIGLRHDHHHADAAVEDAVHLVQVHPALRCSHWNIGGQRPGAAVDDGATSPRAARAARSR